MEKGIPMKQSVVLFVCCSLVMASIGCSQNMGTVRGQAPGQHQPNPYQMAANGGGDMRIAGPQPGVQYYDGPAYDPNQFSSADCPTCPQGNGCPVCPQTRGFDAWRPTHHHTWEYNAPKGLTYPDQNQPPATVQYPYYTIKGPSDFFMK
jgi:hypothetical protein